MWRCGVLDFIFYLLFVKVNFTWNGEAVEGDSPVVMYFLKIFLLFLSRMHWILRLNLGGINT